MFETLAQARCRDGNAVCQTDTRQRNGEQLSIIGQPIGSTHLRHGRHAAQHVLLIAAESPVSQVRFFEAAVFSKKVYSFYAERSHSEKRLLQAGL
ncbi:hypothetical protein [Ensifer aridi]|uniref:hypothetical protein n=1 Tax=Ensifer aridi TaxID=1708715 RepID=UPI00358F8972